MLRRVPVNLGDRSYTVHVGPGLLSQLGGITAAALRRPARRALLVVDGGVSAAAPGAAASLRGAGMDVSIQELIPSEQVKSLETVERLLNKLAESKLERNDVVVALGGGIVGDLAGFAASIYRRGVPFVQCPTTLLAMVDASVGGKTGANLSVGGSLAKNLVGAFHQPSAVIADVSALSSLPDREYRCGLAECIKHGIIGGGDPSLFDWTVTNLPAVLAKDAATLTQLIARNVAIKARIVEQDEREEADDAAGGRALLNLGHTFGHAVETIPGASPPNHPPPTLHGEAVAVGLLAAARCAAHMHLCGGDLPDRIASALAAAGLPTSLKGLPGIGDVLAKMSHDKKNQGGKTRLILPTEVGCVTVVAQPPVEAVRSAIEGMVFQNAP